MSETWMDRQQDAILGAATPGGAEGAPSSTPTGTEYVEYGAPAATGWAGWVVFAGVMMAVLGIFQAIEGLVALFNDGYYAVRPGGLVVHVSYTVWGWTHLVVGCVAVLTGFGLLVGNMLARVVGVLIAAVSAIVNLVFIPAAPFWATIVILIDLIVIYAITVYGRLLKRR
jgi:hypothetical protein